jgi:hypothetical protein
VRRTSDGWVCTAGHTGLALGRVDRSSGGILKNVARQRDIGKRDRARDERSGPGQLAGNICPEENTDRDVHRHVRAS